MPVVNTSGGASLQMADPFAHSSMLASTTTGTTTSTQFHTQNGGYVWTFTGFGFSGGAIPTGGTITGISFSGGGTVTGISYSVAALRNAAEPGPMLAAIFAGNDTINGGAFSDALTGYGGTNVLNGGDGDDLLQTLGVADTLDGGDGIDQLYIERTSSAGVTLNLAGMETATGITLSDGTIVRNVERFYVTTGAGNDVLTFSGTLSSSNMFNAGAGIDRVVIDISGTSESWSQQYDRIVNQFGNGAIFSSVEEFYITTGSGSDSLQGGTRNDRLIAGGGDDVIHGGGGIDYIDGGDGEDALYIDRGATTAAIALNTGDMASSAGVTFADGTVIRNIERYEFLSGSGADVFNITANPTASAFGQSRIDGGGGNDTLNLNLPDLTTSLYLFWYNIETVHATTGSGADTLYGGSGNDELRAGGGDDILYGGSGGVDLLDGGDGADTAEVNLSDVTSPISVTFADFDTASGVTFANGTVVRNVEFVRITAGAGDDVLNLGSSIANGNSFRGGGGFDTIVADFTSSTSYLSIQANYSISLYPNYMNIDVERLVVTGTPNSDSMFGSPTSDANDILNGGGGDDTLGGFGGADILNGGSGNDHIFIDTGADQIDGGTGDDILVYRVAGDQMNVGQTFNMAAFAGMNTAGGATLANGAIIRNMELIDFQLSNADDTAIVGTNSIFSGELYGLGGFDTFQANFAGETRAIHLSYAAYGTVSFGGVFSGFYFSSFDRLLVTAGDANDYISAAGGNDVLSGGQGNDSLNGGAGVDTLHGDAGNDSLFGDVGVDTLYGDAGDDVLDGNDGADLLFGGDGNDLIIYDSADTIDGGAGVDAIVFTSSAAPTSFNLASHGLEGAEGRFSVTGANYTDFYDNQWRLSHERGQASNGSSWFIDWDETSSAPYQRLNQDFDATAQLTHEYGLSDNGSTWDTFFDTDGTHPYVSILQVHTASGVYANEHGINDNGSTWDTFYDVDGTNPFQWIQQVRDANGVLAQEEGLADGGTRWFTDYDETGTTDYVFYQNVYDTLNRLSFQNGQYDTGFTWTIDYDETETQPWTSIRNDYDDHGVLIGTATIWDGP